MAEALTAYRQHAAAQTGPATPAGIALRADLLPPNTWGSNIRALVDEDGWKRLRITVCNAAGNRCQLCGGESAGPDGRRRRPDCHERWTFTHTPDGRHVQRLDALLAL